MELKEEQVEEIIELYDRAQQERRTTKDQEYWQGRKDGLRLALAILQPEETIWENLNESSWGFRDEEWKVIKGFMKDARYNISAILWELQEQKKLHIQTKINLIQWLDQYDRLAKNGTTVPVDDACDSMPGFHWKMR